MMYFLLFMFFCVGFIWTVAAWTLQTFDNCWERNALITAAIIIGTCVLIDSIILLDSYFGG